MTGRGVDQVLPFPSDPALHEPFVESAIEYVAFAEEVNGKIPAPVAFDYVWGDALSELAEMAPDARIVNLETSVTTVDAWEPKGINYRMHPRNVSCLTAAGIHCCVLANNHVLDWGRAGLEETIRTLRSAGMEIAGAGRDLEEAQHPAILRAGGRRVLVFALGAQSSGIPPSWAASHRLPGIDFLPDLTAASAERVVRRVRRHRRPGDLVVVSLHWGGNWGYRVPGRQRTFARRLVDSGAVNVVHGHSSHHPKGMEVRGGRPILYGCGDLINDYEGIGGYEEFRPGVGLLYFATIGEAGLTRLRLVPMRMRRFRLCHASADDTRWLQRTLDEESARWRTRVRLLDGGALEVSGNPASAGSG